MLFNFNKAVSVPSNFQLRRQAIRTLSIPMRILAYVSEIVHIAVRVIIGAMILVIIAHFVPELQSKVPALYSFVDLVLSLFNRGIGILPFI